MPQKMIFSTLLLAACTVLTATHSSIAQATPPKDADPLVSGVPVPAGAVAKIEDRLIETRRFIDHVHDYYRARTVGEEALDDLIRIKLIEINMRRRDLQISDEEVRAEYERLDAEVKKATDGKVTIRNQLAELGQSENEFLRRLRIQTALKRMAEEDFGGNVDAALQSQWLRSKTLEAKIVRDATRLPANAAARVYDDYVTKEEFARNVLSKLPDSEILEIVQVLMQKELIDLLCAEKQIEITESVIDAEFLRAKDVFERNPKFEGLHFEDMIRQQTGMAPESWKKSPNYYVAVGTLLLGEALVPDDEVRRVYEREIDWYGPILEVRHILLRGSDDPKLSGNVRSKAEARRQAETVLKRIRDGESFDEMIKLFSEDTRTKFRGGVMAKLVPREWRKYPAIAKELETMKVGDVRGPIESNRGWHIIELAAKEPPPPLSPDIARDIRKRHGVDYVARRWRSTQRGINVRRFIGHK